MRLEALILLAVIHCELLGQNINLSRAQSKIDVLNYDIEVEITPGRSLIEGSARLTFDVLEDTLSIPFKINNRISLLDVLDEQNERYQQSFDKFNSSIVMVRGIEPFQSGETRTLAFRFEGILELEEYAYLEDRPITQLAVIKPKEAFLFTGGNWFPQHNLPIDEATWNIKVSVPLGFTVVSAGELQDIETFGAKERFTWFSEEEIGQFPVIVGRFFRDPHESKPLSIMLYASENFKGQFSSFAEKIARMSKFFKEEFGDLQIQQLNLVDVGHVRFPVTGAEGMILLEKGIVEAPNFPLMKMTGRIADQWFVYPIEVLSGSDAWLRHGFSNYAALRYIEENNPNAFEKELARMIVQALKYEQRGPISKGYDLTVGSPEFNSVVSAKGAVVLYMLRHLIGEIPFDELFKQWYEEHVLRGEVTTQKFIEFINTETGQDYDWFFLQWIDSTGVPEFRVEHSVFKMATGGFRIRGNVKQDIELFRMPLELIVEAKGQEEEKVLNVRGRNTPFDFEVETLPLRVVVDPKGKLLQVSDMMRVKVHIAIGDEHREMGEFVSAMREFERAKAIEPRSSLAHFRLGEIFFHQNSFTNAANNFRDALNGDLKPPWVESYTQLHLGKIYDVLGERQRAKAEYTKVLNSGVTYMGMNKEAQKLMNNPFSRPKNLLN